MDFGLPLLLEPSQLANALQQSDFHQHVVIIDQSRLENYQSGHIAGSQWVDFKAFQSNVKGLAGTLPDLDQCCELLGNLGIDPTTHIVCSDDEGGGWAGRLIWLLDSLGHRHYSLLNGGLTAWRLQQHPQTTDVTPPIKKPKYPAQEWTSEPSVDKQQLLALLADSSDGEFAVWDARSLPEHRGEKAVSLRGGRIPGAKHYEWTRAMDHDQGLVLRDLEQIRTELTELGISKAQQIVTHCQSHHRSGLTYVIGKLLALPVKAYPGSWSEWGNDPNTPIEKD